MRLAGLAPVWRVDARVLVLGSFPGAASLGALQYYAHPRNAFWPLMAALLNDAELPARPYAERLRCLVDGGIALWDAVASCEREGSLDTAIRDAQPSDLRALVARLPQLRLIACNGATAHRETARLLPGAPWPLLKLPSTSPAHAGLDFSTKRDAWRSALAPALSGCAG